MSEDAAKAPKKKGGKLPIIIVLVLVLAGGGYFMTKGSGDKDKKKGGKKVEVHVEKGETAEVGQYLINLKDTGTYLRTEISIVVGKGIDTKHMMPDMKDELSDAIVGVLQTKSLNDLKEVDGRRKLKYELAFEMSKVVAEILEHHGTEWPKPKMKKFVSASEPVEGEHKAKKKGDDGEDEPVDEEALAEAEKKKNLDCETGPVLRVLFRSFTTQ